MTQTTQYDLNPSAEGAAARVSRVGATPSLSTDTATAWPPLGTFSHKLVATATTIATTGLPNADRPAAAAGDSWSVTAQVRSAQARSVSLSIVFYNTAGATLGTALATVSDTDSFTAGEIRTMLVDGAVAPATTASVDVQVSRNAGGGAAISDAVYVDMVSLTKTAASVPYRDPGSNVFATWNGTANASTQKYWDPVFTLTPAPANLPAPCITVLIDDLPPGVAELTLYRTAKSRTHKVRGAVEVPVASGFSTQDLEAPFQVPSSYRAEMFDSTGASVGFTATAVATLNVYECWVHNPLDPAGAVAIDITDLSGRSIVRPVDGQKYNPENRPLAVFITGRRRGVEGVQMLFETDDDATASKFDAMFGGYEEDDQQVPVLCIRATPFLDLPTPFFAGTLAPSRKPVNVHMGGALRGWEAEADEASPPFAGVVVALLRRMDIDYAFASRNARDAAYSSRLAVDRDYSKAGIAP
jgi:hypothetical protein